MWIIFFHFYPSEYSNDESKGEDFPEEVKGTVYQCVHLKEKREGEVAEPTFLNVGSATSPAPFFKRWLEKAWL